MTTTLNLIDGYGYVFRAYYALPPLSDPKGRPVGAVFGFCRMLLNLLEKHKDEPFAVVLDSGGKNHRHTIYNAYKSHRPVPPEDLIGQFPLIREACKALGVPVIEEKNQEADDLIATYAHEATKKGYKVNIVSADKDLMQLVTDDILLFDPLKNKVIDHAGVVEKFGVPPSQVIDVQALMGDSADNIPGIPGIGPKTAQQLITEYGSLDGIYAHIDAMPKSKRKENLVNHKDLAYISKDLVTLIDLQCHLAIEDLVVRLDLSQAKTFMQNFGFDSLLKKIGVPNTQTPNTVSLNNDAILGKQIIADLKTELNNTSIQFDPFNTYDLASLSLCVFQGLHKHTLSDICAALDMPDASKETVFQVLYQKATDQKILDNYLLCDRFMPFVLNDMEKAGICIDAPCLNKLKDQYTHLVQKIEQKIYETVGMEFNINSPKQLGHVLYEKNQFPTTAKTKTGQFSTDAEALTKLAALGYELPQLILEYRQYTKIISTYLEPLVEKSVDGRVHSTFSHTQTLTGRLASSNPNLQNIPVRTEDGKAVRQAFIASSKDHVLMSFDYSQIELRLLAHYANESALIEAFEKGEDIHTTTAKHLFHDDSDQMRRVAKMVNFGIVYGISAHGLSENLGISRTDAQKIIDDYFKRYPGIRQYIDDQIAKARTHGYVTTITDRPICIADIQSKNPAQRQFAERQATNAPLQGSNAELIKRAMVKIHFWLQQQQLKTKMVLQIHDELIFDAPLKESETVKHHVIQVMQSIFPLRVPIVVNCGVGQNWLAAHS